MEERNLPIHEVDEVNPELDHKWLTFWLDGQRYAAPVAHVEQIVSMMPITEVPEYPRDTKGIIDIRGSIVPLIDLRIRLGKEEAAYTDSTCIIICRIRDAMIGFIADGVDAVMSIAPDQVTAPPVSVDEGPGNYLSGIARLPGNNGEEDTPVLCLDTERTLLRINENIS